MANLKVFESDFVAKLREVNSLDFYMDPDSEFDLSSSPNAVLVSQNTILPDKIPVLSPNAGPGQEYHESECGTAW